ncbi:transposase [Methyloversatilis sp.]|uniref:IS91 family transposase n=1 Tax=Methyloversatilis sp. TaxID=2569862 RepID=UPI0027350550|nr:transposase [Methyloversatilis sp.]MDP2870311.1 transposase [Methyloversatilis sp.]MDP3456041.1 transposase [Methyloversatilis sp.]
MIALAHVIRRFEADYRTRYAGSLGPERNRALQAIKHCRSTLATHLVAACPDCAEHRLIPHSCGHRSCPHCQHFESEQWLERQRRLLVPAEYFLLTFTLPGELRPLARHHARSVYGALFAAAWATVQRFCRNDRQLKGCAGALAVLHTHSRRLDLHPHVHLVMPGASLDARSRRWRTKRGYLFNHRALARVFRGTLLAALKQEGLKLPGALPDTWVVDCKSVGNGDKALVYLGRYLYRGVIREADILSCDPAHDGQVSFRYRDAQSGETKVRTLPGADFLHLILQHVLPRGLRRSRNYGFLHPNSKGLIALLHIVLRIAPRTTPTTAAVRPAFLCPCCGAPMKVIRRRMAPPGASPRPTPVPGAETAV